MKGFVGAVVLIAGLAGAAQAQDGPWRGAWQVEGTSRGRSVVDGGKRGWVAVEVEVEGVPVRCEGPDTFTMLGLTGELPRSKGLAGVLRGDGSPGGPTTVRLEVRPEPDAKDGQLGATASLFHGVRELWRERWTRPGPPGLEVVTVRHRNGTDGYAPSDGPLEVQVRVLGRAQEVSVDVIVAPGADDPRPRFYGEDLVRRERPIAAFGGKKLEVGLHTISWHGRDLTKDERFVLAGQYRLRVDSPERRAAAGPRGDPAPERTLSVAKPWARVLNPCGYELGPQAAAFQGAGFRRSLGGALAPGAFLDLLGRSAVLAIHTHGGLTALDPLGTMKGPYVMASDVRRQGGLEDVHSVYLTACQVGAPGKDSIPQALLDAGVDVVVAMRRVIATEEAEYWNEALAPKLIEYGVPIERACVEAAEQSRSRFWGLGGRLDRRVLMAFFDRSERAAVQTILQNARPIEDALVISVAPGIDKQTETLMPPRHGCSTN